MGTVWWRWSRAWGHAIGGLVGSMYRSGGQKLVRPQPKTRNRHTGDTSQARLLNHRRTPQGYR